MIKKIIDSIAQDKKDHVLLGMFVGYPLMILGYVVDQIFNVDFMLVSGAIAGIALVGLKELIHDWYLSKGKPELADFLYSALPILFSLLTYIIEEKTMNDLRWYLVNAATMAVSFTEIENSLKIALLLVSIAYTIAKTIKIWREKKWVNTLKK